MAVSIQNRGFGSYHLAVAPNLSALADARARLANLLAGSGLGRERVFDAQVVASEAMANAIEHSASSVEVEVWTLPDRVILEVTNPGSFQPGLYKDDDGRRRGLGIPLMVSLADQLHVSRLSSGSTRVTATFFLRPNRAATAIPDQCADSASSNIDEIPGPPLLVWSLIPLAAIVLIVLAVMRHSGVYSPQGVVAVLDIFCITIPMVFAAVLAMRNYLAGRAPAVLLVGASSLMVGAGAFLAAVDSGGSSAGSQSAVYWTAALLGGVGFLAASLLSRLPSGDKLSRRFRVATAVLTYAVAVVVLVLVSQLVRSANWPAYFVQGSGGTQAGLIIVRLAALMFATAAVAMALLPGRRDLGLRRWYAVGLGLLAIGFASWSLQIMMGDSLNWMGRASQYLGSLVILGGLIMTARTTGGWSLPLERELRESQERYETLAKLSLDGVVVIEEGKIIFANDAAAHMLGVASTEGLVGREAHALIHPEDYSAFEDMLNASASGEPCAPLRARLVGANDSIVDVVITGSQARIDGKLSLQLILHDVTSLEDATRAVNDVEDRLALALESVHCGSWDIDLTTMAIDRNQTYDRILGIEAGTTDWTHQQFLDQVLPEDRDMVAERFTRAIETRGELTLECRVGRTPWAASWVSLAGRCHPDSSGRWKLSGVIQDISSRKACEGALERSADELQAAMEENDRLRQQQTMTTDSVQTSLLHVPSTIGPLHLSNLYRSATDPADAGGDFFDAFRLANDKVAVLIGDVAGHGVDAARAATLTKNLIHAFAQQTVRPEQILYRANTFLVDTALPGFITLFLGILDLRTMQLKYSSAGHPEGLLRRTSGSLESLSSGSAPLAVYPEVSWMQWSVQLEDGDLLFLYTDGVIEARSDGEFFGEDRLQSLVRRKGANAQLLPGLVLDNILAFSTDRLQDDVAVLAVEITEETGDFEEAS